MKALYILYLVFMAMAVIALTSVELQPKAPTRYPAIDLREEISP